MSNRRGFGNMKPKSGNNDSLRLEEIVDILKFSDYPDEWVQLRFLDGDILPCKRHWVKIFAGKEKKQVTVPRWCISFDPENESEPLADVHCPYCDLSTGQDGTMRNEHFYLCNAIVRDIQEDEPARKAEPNKKERSTGYKDIKTKSWTPVRVIRLTNSLVARMQEIAETNIVTNPKTKQKKAFDVSHERYGCDINVKYKPKESGSNKYSADKVEGRTPLTDEEKEYLIWDINPSILDEAGKLTPEKAAEDFKRMEIVDAEEIDEEEDEDDSYDLGKSRRSKKKKSRHSESLSDDDYDEDDEDEDEEDEPPRRSRKKKRSSSARSGTRKKSSSSSRRRKSKLDDEDDEDGDDAWSEDEEEEKPRRSKTRAKSKSSSRSSSRSSKRPAKSKSSSSKSKRSVFDDDDDWDDE